MIALAYLIALPLAVVLAVLTAALGGPAPPLVEDGRQHGGPAPEAPTAADVEADALHRHQVAVWALCLSLGIATPSVLDDPDR